MANERSRNTESPSFWGFFALHDLMILGFLSLLLLLAWQSAPSADRSAAISGASLAVFTLLAGCAVGRMAVRLPAWLRGAVYRTAAVLSLVQSYLVLKPLLAAYTSRAVDSALLAADQRWLGGTPALWFEPYAKPEVVEYFAFFYFSYFPLSLIVTLLVFARPTIGAEGTRFAVGTALVMGLGQLCYLLVPAYGPVQYLSSEFAAPLQGGRFWSLVLSIVDSAGAQRDVFPSLHTAMPTWFSLYMWGEARRAAGTRSRPWLVAAASVLSVFAVHIIISTMFLRWHYAIDVVAGLMLATTAYACSDVLARFDARRRDALGVPAAFATGSLTSR